MPETGVRSSVDNRVRCVAADVANSDCSAEEAYEQALMITGPMGAETAPLIDATKGWWWVPLVRLEPLILRGRDPWRPIRGR